MKKFKYKTPAKINLFLGVGSRRFDGYHELITLYQSISIYDKITLTIDNPKNKGITISGTKIENLRWDDSNLAYKAAQLCAKEANIQDPNLEIHIDKTIPIAAGLAGGSSDAAAIINLCGNYWNLNQNIKNKIAEKLGSDINFLLEAKTAIGSDRGQKITTLNILNKLNWVIVTFNFGLSTSNVYQTYDFENLNNIDTQNILNNLLTAIPSGKAEKISPFLYNDLQNSAIKLAPDLHTILDLGTESGALTAMVSGSGPTCIFLCKNKIHTKEVAEKIKSNLKPKLKMIVKQIITAQSPTGIIVESMDGN